MTFCRSIQLSKNHQPARRAEKPYLGGAERDRTADPLVANQVLSQLSYSPLPYIATNPALAPRGVGCTPSCSTGRMAEARWWA